MLMDILMESLMSMDEDTLDYVLESCSDEEMDIIDNMVMEDYLSFSRPLGVPGGYSIGHKNGRELCDFLKNTHREMKFAKAKKSQPLIDDINTQRQMAKGSIKKLATDLKNSDPSIRKEQIHGMINGMRDYIHHRSE